jgi:hypothetical protein
MSRRAAALGVELGVPEGWEAREDAVPGGGLLLLPRERDAGFTPNVTLVAAPPAEDRETYLGEQALGLRRVLTDLDLLDVEAVEVAGLDGLRLLAAFRQGVYALTLEQWHALSPAGTHVLSLTVESAAYAALAPLGEAVAASLAVLDGAAGGDGAGA